MEENVKRLNEKREYLENLKQKKKKAQEEFNEYYACLFENIESVENDIKLIEHNIENYCLKEFKETKNKNFYGGISIKEYKTIEYEEEKAFEWAKAKKLFLLFDKKGFEKAVESLNLDFVKINKEPKVTYPKIIKLEG